ncbi:hypothetical protein [Pinibacter aurantiacus]|uniref:Uncharacterized protein n=1 Tax=Pinibacter aurantiacus TaxID=2851599 RepID=A0A9E2SC11_9BACT|nr:hypothetical protein [Pinibacter aurantiacus]MBV4358552.1 hypothetical protein [Pinibacter aurantiacus]
MLRFTILLTTLFFFCACTRTIGTKDLGTVLVPDPADPQLPVYSETGLNTLGAYYNNGLWTSSSNGSGYIVVGYKADSIVIGLRAAPGLFQLKFLIPKHTVGTLEDLVFLNDSTFDLSNNDYKVKIDTGLINVQSGSLSIKRCRKLVINNAVSGVIISGTFDLSGTRSNGPVILRKGRFDLVVGKDRFVYNYWF